MRLLLYLGHPAQFHLFKNLNTELVGKNHNVKILLKSKDILEDLCKKSNFDYVNIYPRQRKNNKLSLLISTAQRFAKILLFSLKFKPDLIVGSDVTLPLVGKVTGTPSLIFSEDDAHIIPSLANTAYPFVTNIVSPATCNAGKWENKKISYPGFHKLAYLHPMRFVPDPSKKITEIPYFILRFSSLNAYHDNNRNGINDDIADELISILSPHGKVFISSERDLPGKYLKYNININPLDIHHVLYYSRLLVCDSQSMAVEAAMLGTPSIRFNDFAGEIGVLEELEHKYCLTFGIRTNQQEKLYATLQRLLNTEKLQEEFRTRRDNMLKDKIDVTAFYVWLIESFPESIVTLKKNPQLIYQFK